MICLTAVSFAAEQTHTVIFLFSALNGREEFYC